MELIIAKTFKLTKKLGQGAFGEIYQAINLKNYNQVAVKLQPVKTSHPQLFYQAKLLAYLNSDQSINNKGIPQVYYSGTQGQYNLMVIDLLGPSLEQLFQFCEKIFDLKTSLIVALQLIDRIQFVHSKKFIHRDIKPDNFLIGMYESIIFQEHIPNHIWFIQSILVLLKNILEKMESIYHIEIINYQQEPQDMPHLTHIQEYNKDEGTIFNHQDMSQFIFQKVHYLGKIQKQTIKNKNMNGQCKKSFLQQFKCQQKGYLNKLLNFQINLERYISINLLIIIIFETFYEGQWKGKEQQMIINIVGQKKWKRKKNKTINQKKTISIFEMITKQTLIFINTYLKFNKQLIKS